MKSGNNFKLINQLPAIFILTLFEHILRRKKMASKKRKKNFRVFDIKKNFIINNSKLFPDVNYGCATENVISN